MLFKRDSAQAYIGSVIGPAGSRVAPVTLCRDAVAAVIAPGFEVGYTDIGEFAGAQLCIILEAFCIF
jgi:hypothetical protein